MKVYKRAEFIIAAFDMEDVITTSGVPEPTINPEDLIAVDHSVEEPIGTWW